MLPALPTAPSPPRLSEHASLAFPPDLHHLPVLPKPYGRPKASTVEFVPFSSVPLKVAQEPVLGFLGSLKRKTSMMFSGAPVLSKPPTSATPGAPRLPPVEVGKTTALA